jgi:hypothetical protein
MCGIPFFQITNRSHDPLERPLFTVHFCLLCSMMAHTCRSTFKDGAVLCMLVRKSIDAPDPSASSQPQQQIARLLLVLGPPRRRCACAFSNSHRLQSPPSSQSAQASKALGHLQPHHHHMQCRRHLRCARDRSSHGSACAYLQLARGTQSGRASGVLPT